MSSELFGGGDEVYTSQFYAFEADDIVTEFCNVADFAAKQNHLQAIVMVKVKVH